MKKICLSGVAGAGKTTLLNTLTKFNNIYTVSEGARNVFEVYKEYPRNIRQDIIFATFLNTEIEFDKFFNNEELKDKVIVYDRPIIDVIVYTYLFGENEVAEKQLKILKNKYESGELKHYDKIYYLTYNIYSLDEDDLMKIEKEIISDTVRRETLQIKTLHDYFNYIEKHNEIFFNVVRRLSLDNYEIRSLHNLNSSSYNNRNARIIDEILDNQ